MICAVKFRMSLECKARPVYHSAQASGFDLASAEDLTLPASMMISTDRGNPVGRIRVQTGLYLEIPHGYEGQVRPRSSLSAKGIVVAFGTIDSDYRGEISVVLYNLSGEDFRIKAGDRIAQLVIAPVMQVNLVQVEELSSTERGEAGWGSTGR